MKKKVPIPRFSRTESASLGQKASVAVIFVALALAPALLLGKPGPNFVAKTDHGPRTKNNLRGPDFGQGNGSSFTRGNIKSQNRAKSPQRGRNAPEEANYHSQSSLGHGFGGVVYIFQEFFSPQDGKACPRHPVCSLYGQRAIQGHGGFWGTIMAVDRIMRCHPWQHSLELVDPVPTSVFPDSRTQE